MSINSSLNQRLRDFSRQLARQGMDAACVMNLANIRALTGVVCDHACLIVRACSRGVPSVMFLTDFRYTPMVHRIAPDLPVREIKTGETFAQVALIELGDVNALGFESVEPAASYLALCKAFPKTKLVDVQRLLVDLRAVKTYDEAFTLACAIRLNDQIWSAMQAYIQSGMTEKQIQRIIQGMMISSGEGEAFETIVCAGANTAECHHVPNETVWEEDQPLLVDMGLKYRGLCSDMTRNIKPKGRSALVREYRNIYALVLKANRAAIAAARPGLRTSTLDQVARKVIEEAGYGAYFGHALGHGVGYEIHEEPTLRPKGDRILRTGMFVTIEPGIYIEGKFGVRIEDVIMITSEGCSVLTKSAK